MPNARYLRDQSALCLRLASGIRDPEIAQKLRETAARFLPLRRNWRCGYTIQPMRSAKLTD